MTAPNGWDWPVIWERCRAEVARRALPVEYADAAAVVVDSALEGFAMAGIDGEAVGPHLDLVTAAVEVVRVGVASGELDDGPAYVALQAARRGAA